MASVFFSYSHKDEDLRNELEDHLALLKHQGLIESWHDRRLVAGSDFDDSIMSAMESCEVILLLVSSAFLASKYCYSREMTRAMERHEAGTAIVIPVILRHCEWHAAPFGKLLAAPRDGRPVTSWPDKDEAFTDVARQVRRAVENLKPVQSKVPVRAAIDKDSRIYSMQSQQPNLPRSSNLRMKREFTEQDKDEFLREAFEFIIKFFEGSIEAVMERHPGVTGRVERIDSRRMAAVLYQNGKTVTQCAIRLGGFSGFGGKGLGEITFSYGASSSVNSFNECASVQASDQSLYFKTMGMAWHGGEHNQQLTQTGLAEAFWSLFFERVQR